MTNNRRRVPSASPKMRYLLQFSPWIRTFATMALILCVLLVVYLGIRGLTKSSTNFSSGGVILAGATPQDTFFPMGNLLVYFNGTYARAHNAKGEFYWERSADSSAGLQCATSTELMVLYKGNSLYIYDTTGEVGFSGIQSQNIKDVAVGNSSVALRLEDDSIIILSDTGKLLDTLFLPDKTLMDFGFYSSKDLVWVMALDVSGIETVSLLNTYEPGKMLLDGRQSTTELFVRPLFFRENLYIVGTKTLHTIPSTGDEISSLIYGWSLRDTCTTLDTFNILFTLSAQGDAPTTLRVITPTKTVDMRMPQGCTDILMGEKEVYGFAGNILHVLPLSGKKTVDHTLPYVVDKVLMRLNNKTVLLSAQGQVRLITLP